MIHKICQKVYFIVLAIVDRAWCSLALTTKRKTKIFLRLQPNFKLALEPPYSPR